MHFYIGKIYQFSPVCLPEKKMLYCAHQIIYYKRGMILRYSSTQYRIHFRIGTTIKRWLAVYSFCDFGRALGYIALKPF